MSALLDKRSKFSNDHVHPKGKFLLNNCPFIVLIWYQFVTYYCCNFII